MKPPAIVLASRVQARSRNSDQRRTKDRLCSRRIVASSLEVTMSRSRQGRIEIPDEQSIAPSETAERPQATVEDIAERAYALYLARGAQHGHDVEDWLQAERDLLDGGLDPALMDDGSTL